MGAASHVHGLTTAARQFSLAHSELRDGTNRILRYVTWAIVPTAVLLVATSSAETRWWWWMRWSMTLFRR